MGSNWYGHEILLPPFACHQIQVWLLAGLGWGTTLKQERQLPPNASFVHFLFYLLFWGCQTALYKVTCSGSVIDCGDSISNAFSFTTHPLHHPPVPCSPFPNLSLSPHSPSQPLPSLWSDWVCVILPSASRMTETHHLDSNSHRNSCPGLLGQSMKVSWNHWLKSVFM